MPLGGGGVLGFIVLFLVVVAFLVIRQRIAAGSGGAGQDMASAQYEQARPAATLDALRARDPAVSEQSIVEHTVQMADILRGAWCGGDMRPARPFVSDGVFSRFAVQLALMRQENRRNVMGDARVQRVTLEAVEAAGPLDVVHVRVDAEARDTEVAATANDDQIRSALAHTRVEPYSEIWSLVRRGGAQSKPSGYAVGKACPSCGAPLTEGEMIKCRYCGALVCSGEHDWVLAEITQLEEWRPGGQGVRGLAELHARDPGVAREVLEDRASYLFWKWVEAGRAGAFGPLRKCSAPALLEAGARLEQARSLSDVAVGGADLLGCDVGGADGFDRVFVMVSWSARVGGSRDHTPARTVLRLARRSGVTSRLSMTSLVCTGCGAPLAESDSTRCDHCGAELAAGGGAWVLDGVLRPEEA
jgi:DNA-directed RNA polymerase subunit RPC12/RpoP